MTDLQPYEPRNTLEQADPTGGRLIAWAQAMNAAHQMGKALCTTSFVPKHFKDNAEDCAAAIMFGDEIGLTPGQALQNVYVISGKPSLYARAMVALVLSHGHEIWTEASSPQRVVVCGRRRGTSHVERVEWTTSKAQAAGYTTNSKYKTNPEAMLYARASGDVARRVAPDALAGIAYTVEEAELGESPNGTVTVSRADQPKRTAKRAQAAPPPADEPELDEATPAAEPAPTGDSTDAQRKNLHRLFGAVGWTEREDRLRAASVIIGRPLGSSNELMKDEASRLIDALEECVRTNDPQAALADLIEVTEAVEAEVVEDGG